MDVLQYNELNVSRVKKQYDKIVSMIRRDDFYSADVKKLSGTGYYRAKLDYTNRLLFKVVTYNGCKYALALEVIHNHEYEKSRFLNGAKINESKINDEVINEDYFSQVEGEQLHYINSRNKQFHILDKIISFDAHQDEVFKHNPPLIIIGSAGSGKTVLTLEKMKSCQGSILYVTHSVYLVQNSRQLYYANNYSNDDQDITFLSYQEFLESIKVPSGREINFLTFKKWFNSLKPSKACRNANKLYEEFKGVITGNRLNEAFLSYKDYINLGVKQSIFLQDEREEVYNLFRRYLTYLKENNFYDTNLLSFNYFEKAEGKYDFIVIDEVQDFTIVQLTLILKLLLYPQQFILCGDANQIIHPNFFSWAKIKTLFHQTENNYATEVIRVLNKNYRNAPAITAVANKILKAKNARFGSIDKESHYLVEGQSTTNGDVYCLLENDAIRQEINNKTYQSAHFAVIVLREDQKAMAQRYFQTPLIFSVYEAKGLEYENIILYNFVSSEEKQYREIANGLTADDLEAEFNYSRAKDKSDRSLEIYKFYINALYVAVTRAIKNIYFIEHIEKHPLLGLLNLLPTPEFVALEIQKSSLEEWEQEASRLEKQGKAVQADAIRKTVLQKQPVPWPVITNDSLLSLQSKAYDSSNKDKAARLLLFEYALHYKQYKILDKLIELKFSPALKPKKNYTLIERKYFMGYNSSNTAMVMREVNLYGIDFRTVFNQTPLMVACHFGNEILINKLINNSANTNLIDNLGRNAFQIVLQKALLEKHFAKNKLLAIYTSLMPDSISLNIEDKLVKIDAKRMEFFILNAMIAMARLKEAQFVRAFSFKVDDFLRPLAYFPERIMPERRKKRPYISSILAKNEINRQDLYNKKLFLRIKIGHYVFNPRLKIKLNENWVNIYTALNIEKNVQSYSHNHCFNVNSETVHETSF